MKSKRRKQKLDRQSPALVTQETWQPPFNNPQQSPVFSIQRQILFQTNSFSDKFLYKYKFSPPLSPYNFRSLINYSNKFIFKRFCNTRSPGKENSSSFKRFLTYYLFWDFTVRIQRADSFPHTCATENPSTNTIPFLLRCPTLKQST